MKPFTDHLKRYSFLFGLVLFVIILLKLNPAEIFKNVKEINPWSLLLASLLLLPMLIVKTYCWNYIKRKQGINYSLKDSFLMYCSGVYIGFLTPGRVGEAVKALYLKKDGHSLGKSLTSIFLDRLSDLVFLSAFACLGSLFFLALLKKQFLIFILSLVILTGLFFITLKTKLARRFLNKIFIAFIPTKYQESFKINFQDFINDLKIYNLKGYSVIMFITALSWFVYFLQMYILAQGVGIHVSPYYLSVAVTIVGLVTIIPVSISGIGTRDAALVIFLSPLLVPKEQIIVFSTLILLVSLFAVLIGLICWFIKPLR